MNIGEYISSGIVESYVLGIATEEERAEFERECKYHPELVEARNAFELRLETQMIEGSKQPPQHILAQLLPRIKLDAAIQQNVVRLNNPGASKAGSGSRRMVQYLAAASAVILLCCGFFLYRLQQQNSNLTQTNKKLLEKYKTSDSTLNSLVNEESLAGLGMAVVHLTGAKAPTQPQANIYWDSASAAVYLVAKNLPQLPADKQYQLWAQIDGKPRSLGVFDAGSGKVILKMNNSKKAEAFAITVEAKGGDSVPSTSVQAKGIMKEHQ